MKIYQVDAFTERPFTGNPAGVCILEAQKDDEWLQNVAGEMNLSETAFIFRRGEEFDLRWFTPTAEVDLCGHATLAGAHILWEKGYLQKDKTAKFSTKSGLLTAEYKDGWVQLNFPAIPESKTEPPDELVSALGVKPVYVGKNIFDFLVEVESEEIVRSMNTNLIMISKIPARGVIVTAKSREYDFVSRFFAPNVGISEDPVTGSAHCCLGPYWMERLGKSTFTAYQASKRGGILKVEVVNDRVLIFGKAVTVIEGDLFD